MRYDVKFMCILLVLGVHAPCASADEKETEDQAIALVEKLGGTVERDDRMAGKPVYCST